MMTASSGGAGEHLAEVVPRFTNVGGVVGVDAERGAFEALRVNITGGGDGHVGERQTA